ncbi:P-loop ATPase, Sll1717 family [Halotalea alkalilenta]|uniref:P-loop ATPase, Sll1717 family n=1 Tax=Halotalea alkalilenta TaxID=376489 RepID=UPI0012378ECA|nr:hypothetical protein [Halotalea alkalilenta]
MGDFSQIVFGYSSAETERARDPGLITEGHVDFRSVDIEATTGSKFLFLGYKGSGKSSIAERIELNLHDKHNAFARVVSLQDFPFTPFAKIIRGDSEPETKYPSAWSWILLIYLLESFEKDEGLSYPESSIFRDAVKAFREMGLSPKSDPASIVRTSARHSFKLSLPGRLAEYSWAGSETKPASEIPNFVESLKELISDLRSESNHYLIIDGLDDILTAREVQYKSLSALIYEVSRLNSSFARKKVPAKIILLCRTDLFERLPGSNNNKIRQDFSIEMDWYHDPNDPDNSLLLKAAQIRAVRSLQRELNLFDDFFPPTIDGTSSRKYLLDMTRHTPRDFLQLLNYIQNFASAGKLTIERIKSGMREYSIKYFLPEIKDELNGYARPDEISKIIKCLGKVRKRDFHINELIDVSRKSPNSLMPERILEIVEALFECSALGNIQHRSGGTTFYTFKYRNRHSSFNEDENIILHRGLWKALNLR